jgi:hypothetical protein
MPFTPSSEVRVKELEKSNWELLRTSNTSLLRRNGGKRGAIFRLAGPGHPVCE